MLIENKGCKISASDIALIEEKIGLVLPIDYATFLLDCNGGTPTPDVVDIPSLPGTPTDLQLFFGIHRDIESSNILWNASLVEKRHPGFDGLPIACDSGGNIFFLAGGAENFGVVFYCDLESDGYTTYRVADDFGAFIGAIRDFES